MALSNGPANGEPRLPQHIRPGDQKLPALTAPFSRCKGRHFAVRCWSLPPPIVRAVLYCNAPPVIVQRPATNNRLPYSAPARRTTKQRAGTYAHTPWLRVICR
jgi:hypothetical protein